MRQTKQDASGQPPAAERAAHAVGGSAARPLHDEEEPVAVAAREVGRLRRLLDGIRGRLRLAEEQVGSLRGEQAHLDEEMLCAQERLLRAAEALGDG